MTRLPRRILPETCDLHVYSRGIRRERIFLRERDGDAFLFRVALACERFDLECRTYCLMPNHFHFLLSGRRTDVSDAMRWLIGGYAVWFNKQHGHRGHLFGDRFGARLIDDAADAVGTARYILLNPVEAGLCEHPRQWKWSSYRATVGLELVPAFLSLGWLDQVMSRASFAAYVDEGLAALELAA
jgi:REP element-mobilizing transposase RayT